MPAEKAKCDLSSLNVTEINLPFIANDDGGARHLNHRNHPRDYSKISSETSFTESLDAVSALRHRTQASAPAGQIDHVRVSWRPDSDAPGSAVPSATSFKKSAPQGCQCRTKSSRPAPPIQGRHARPHRTKGRCCCSTSRRSLWESRTFDGKFAVVDSSATRPSPTRKSHIFTTTRDGQAAVKIRVSAGRERSLRMKIISSESSCLSDIP